MNDQKLNRNITTKENCKIYDFKQIITTFYVVLILIIFPVAVRRYYFDIMTFKYQFYYFTTLIYLIALLCYDVYSRFFNKKNTKNNFNKLSLIELSMLCFLVIAIISTLQSDFLYESFWGNEGRYSGCFLLLLYGFSTILVYKNFIYKKWILDVFLISGFLVCAFGITDFFQLNILSFKDYIEPTQFNVFVSTIGNLNTYTSFVALVMGVSTVLYAKETNFIKVLFYYFIMLISFFAIMMGLSDNAYLALGILFGFLPLYLFSTKSGIKRYLFIITTFTSAIYIIGIINKTMYNRIIKIDGILLKLSSFDKLSYIVFSLIMLCLLSYIIDYISKNKRDQLGKIWKLAWFVGLVFLSLSLAYILYDVNIAGNIEKYKAYSSYLLINDDWGTHRGFNWRIGIQDYKKFPMIHKLFGHGPDTYGIMTRLNNFTEMTTRYQEEYDSAHNEYLQYFITMGPLSLLSYLTFMVSSGIRMVRCSNSNVGVYAAFYGVLCYAAQAFVNISVPIVAPVMFILLAIGLAGTQVKDSYSKTS
jgi:hypothetical protein